MGYAIPKDVDNALTASMEIKTPNKVKQVVYGKLEGTLNSLLAMSNNQVAKIFINLDVRRSGSSPAIEAKKFSDSVISNQPHRLSILVFCGTKEAGARAFSDAGVYTSSPQSVKK